MAESSFRELLKAFRAGDPQAREQLMREYEPQIRRIVRNKLRKNSLRAHTESADLVQSIMVKLLDYERLDEVESPEDLIKLLTTMGKNKVINQAEYFDAGKRDVRRTQSMNVEERPIDIADDQATPSAIVSNQEQIEQAERVLAQLPAEIRGLLEQRKHRTWQELGKERGEKPDTLRMRCERELERARRKVLGGDDTRT